MRILIADQFNELGGAQRVLLELLEAFQRQGWTSVLAVPGRGPLRTRAEELGIPCEEITCGPFGCGSKSSSDVIRFGVQFPKLRAQFRRLLANVRPDVLYLNAPRLVPAACSLGGPTPPVLFHAHSYLQPRYIAALTGGCLQRVGASVVANCQFVLEPLREYIRDSAARVVYNGVPDMGPAGSRPRTGRIGMIGRICPEKGQRVFVEAARLVAPSLPTARFVICGATQFSDDRSESYFQDLRQFADGLPLEFIGWHDDIGAILRSLDLLVVASMPQAEATTRVILEAYSAGVPVLASDLPGIREILEDGETGFLFPAGKAGMLANRIHELMVSTPPENLSAITTHARHHFEERYSLDVFQRQMVSNLEMVGAKALT